MLLEGLVCVFTIHVQVHVPSLLARFSHSATAVSLGPGLTEVAIFGGCDDEVEELANTTVLRFGESMTSSIFGGNGRRVIEYRGEALVATICRYISTLTGIRAGEGGGGGGGGGRKVSK